jgi:hypothetical protein
MDQGPQWTPNQSPGKGALRTTLPSHLFCQTRHTSISSLCLCPRWHQTADMLCRLCLSHGDLTVGSTLMSKRRGLAAEGTGGSKFRGAQLWRWLWGLPGLVQRTLTHPGLEIPEGRTVMEVRDFQYSSPPSCDPCSLWCALWPGKGSVMPMVEIWQGHHAGCAVVGQWHSVYTALSYLAAQAPGESIS